MIRAAVTSGFRRRTGRPGLARRALVILLPAAAGAGLVLARLHGASEGVALVAMISVYDAAAYLIGTGARFAVEGPIAGVASIGALTLFLAAQARSFVYVMRCRRAALPGRRRRHTDVLWTSIPVLIVLALCARSWVAVFDLQRPATASAVVAPAPDPGVRPR